MKLSYERPVIQDFGSIAAHTFTRAGGSPLGNSKKKGDWMQCSLDKHGEYSCGGDHGLS
jgi:hypothetical protein